MAWLVGYRAYSIGCVVGISVRMFKANNDGSSMRRTLRGMHTQNAPESVGLCGCSCCRKGPNGGRTVYYGHGIRYSQHNPKTLVVLSGAVWRARSTPASWRQVMQQQGVIFRSYSGNSVLNCRRLLGLVAWALDGRNGAGVWAVQRCAMPRIYMPRRVHACVRFPQAVCRTRQGRPIRIVQLQCLGCAHHGSFKMDRSPAWSYSYAPGDSPAVSGISPQDAPATPVLLNPLATFLSFIRACSVGQRLPSAGTYSVIR